MKSEEIVCLPNDVRAGGQVAVEDWKKSALLISKFSTLGPNRGVEIERWGRKNAQKPRLTSETSLRDKIGETHGEYL